MQYQILYRASGFSTLKDGGNVVPAILSSSKEAALHYVRSCMARQIHGHENNLDAYRNKHWLKHHQLNKLPRNAALMKTIAANLTISSMPNE